MTVINKQKFLAELGQLLTFMYEEDRLSALEMYAKIFDNCSDIPKLMQVLVSPTRQAVVIARAYDAAERKLQIQSVSRADAGIEDSGELPDFVVAIDNVFQQVYEKGLMEDAKNTTPVLENQISIFEEVDPSLFEPDEDEIELVEESFELPFEDTPVEEPVEESVAEAVEEPVAESVEEVVEEKPEEDSLPLDEVDAFLAGFSIDEKELVPVAEPEVPAESSEEEPAEEESEDAEESIEQLPAEETEAVQVEIEAAEVPAEEVGSKPETLRKAKPFLLALYTIFAIPVCIVGLALLLVPAALILALACLVVLAGSASFAAAFGGFAVFADMLVILGTALIVSAIGLMLVWLFVLFLGGVMGGFVKSIIRLGKKCCYKEVAAV